MAAMARAMSVAFMCALAALLPDQAAAQTSTPFDSQHCPPIAPCKEVGVLPPGCSCSSGNDLTTPPDLPAPPGCDPEQIRKQLGTLSGTIKFVTGPHDCGISAAHCEALPGRRVEQLADGTSICAPTNCSKTCYTFGKDTGGPEVKLCSTCLSLPIVPKDSWDPNDKAGSIGVGGSQFVRGDSPLSYAIHFENLSTATAPAQAVVVTDRLDPGLVDFDTFRLGPVAFADNTLLPAPGVRGWTGGIDLRPAQNLIVAISAGIDKSAGIVTWRFTSLDPGTGQLTDNPDAGFLPPNTNPPAGEGSVAFTVMPKSGLATGTPIQNQAVVVFDTNAPIATPTWLNTIDNDTPKTRVLPLAAVQSSSTFAVQWTGSDVGSGTSGFTIFVSDNGGPFTKWLDGTVATSASYQGQTGHSYGFFSIGTDLVGNTEPLKTVAEATTHVGPTSGCATDISNQLQITRSGYGFNFTTQRFVQMVTFKNISTAPLTGPLSLVLDNLSANATLFNPSGTTACALPAGSPYVNFSVNLNPGGSTVLSLQFVDPTRTGITYATRVLAGSAGR